MLARMRPRIEAASPAPRVHVARDADTLGDRAHVHVAIVDVPGHGPIVDALAGGSGHAPLKRQQVHMIKLTETREISPAPG